MIKACLYDKRPFAVISPIDGITSFLAIDSEDRYASVAIVARSLQHVAVAVASRSTVAVGTHHTALVQRDGGPWIPASETAAPACLARQHRRAGQRAGPRWWPTGTLFPESGNPILLNGVVLGSVEAVYQPDGSPCESAAIYIAAAAGRTTVRAVSGRLLTHPYQVQALLINALRKGTRCPASVAARDELAAHRLLNHLRRCGIA